MEPWLAAILDRLSTNVFVKDVDGRYLYANAAAARTAGRAVADIIGRTDRDLLPADVADALVAHDQAVLRGEAAQEYDETIRVGDAVHTFRALKFPYRDDEGRVVGLCGLSHDVTDAQTARAQLHQEQEVVRRVFASSSDGILAFDTENRYTAWNPRMERISGLRAELVLGRAAFELFPFLLETGEDVAFREALAGREYVSAERMYSIPESGKQGYFEGVYSPLHDVDGRVIGGLGVIRDITERRRVEQERIDVARTEAERAVAEEAARRFEFLANASTALASSLDYEQTLQQLAHLALPLLGDLCVVDVDEDGQLKRVASAHVLDDKNAVLDEVRHRYPTSPSSPQPAARAMRTGKSELFATLEPDVLAAHTYDEHHASLLRRIGLKSLIAVPLIARGHVLGSLSLGITESDRRYDARDVALAEELARRAAIAVDNARLYQIARRSETRSRALVEQSPLSTQVFAADGRTRSVNGAWEKLWGLTLDQLHDYNILQDPELAVHGVDKLLARAVAGEPVEIPAHRYDLEVGIPERSQHADPVRWVRAYAYPVRDVTGRVDEVVLVHEDVTARRRAEERLQLLADAGATLGVSLDPAETLQALARVVVPRMADWCGIDIVDEHGTLQRVAVQHSDPSRIDLVQQLFHRYPPRKDGIVWTAIRTANVVSAAMTDDMLQAMAQDADHLRIIRTLGIRTFICVPLIARGEAIGALSLVHAESQRAFGEADIALATDLARRAAAAIDNARLYQRLREEDRRKDEFLATLAHELRNPLAPIRSGLDVLRSTTDSALGKKTRTVMERQVSHMVRLVDDLLDLSRITQGKIQLQPEMLDVDTLVQQALDVSRPLLDAAGVTVAVSIPPTPLTLRGDRTRLAQVLSNVLNNAAKYTPRGGRVDVDVTHDGADVLFRIRDTGIGIAHDQLGHIFDMFAQIERPDRRGQGGLGIGLTLVRRLVELHGGTVWAESAGADRGSTFTIRIPGATATTTPHATDTPTPSTSTSTTPRNVLLVDDNTDAVELLAMLLELEGHHVRIATSGPEALDVLRDFRPDVAFLDIGLPGMSGYELAGHMRAIPALASVTLVALTGWGQAEDRRMSREAGFAHHLTKPVEPSQVHALLRPSPDAT